jgi:tetratricopeptide (TPR) repeat protein
MAIKALIIRHNMNIKRVIICTSLLVASFGICHGADGKSSSLDPGTLVSVETKDGETIEKYSDGLIVHISKNGDFSEDSTESPATMEVNLPSDYGHAKDNMMVDDFIEETIDLSWMHGGWDENSSSFQSRLRQFSSYYLSMGEPAKAVPLAEQYLQIQKVLKVGGEPLAFAEKNLGEAKLAMNKLDEAIPLLEESLRYYESSKNVALFCVTSNVLASALTKSGRPDEALKILYACQKTASQSKLTAIGQNISVTIKQALGLIHNKTTTLK